MKWPFFSENKNRGSAIYFGLFLKQEEGICLLLEAGRGGARIICKEKFVYSNGWDKLTEDVDEILFKIEKETKKTVKETIFFVYSYLINQETGDIDRIYLNKIKNLAKNLEIKPVGFIEVHDAIISQIEKKEEIRLTAIVLELDKNFVDLFIYKSGRKIYSKIIRRTDDIASDVELVLLKAKDETVLPSRVLIYNSVDLNELSIQLVSYKWKSDVFIQAPRVEIVGEGQIFQALTDLFYRQLIDNKEEEEVMGFLIGREIPDKEIMSPAKPKERVLSKFKDQLSNLFQKIKMPKFSLNIFLIVGPFLIIVAVILGEFFLHRADLIIYAPTKAVEDKLSLSGKEINIYYATSSADISVSKTTTGKKYIGDNAKGEVTIRNYDSKEITFSKGTIIESSGLQFGIDSEVKVPASTLTTDLLVDPGKTKVKVTAFSIGSESNLGKGQKFTISDKPASLYFAINELSFFGGTKKEIRTVAKDDLEDLKTQAMEQGRKSPQIPSLTEYKLENLEFSKEIGEEANDVELKTKVISSYYGYKEKDMIDFLANHLKTNVVSGYTISPGQITYKISSAKKTGNSVDLAITVKAKSEKKINTPEVLNKITGKDKKQLEKIIKYDLMLSGYKLNIRPQFFLFSDKLPYIKRNITLSVSSL